MLPAIEVGLGLAVTFFVISLASSSIVGIIATTAKLRARGVERAIGDLLGKATPDTEQVDVAAKFVDTALVKSLREADAAWTIFGNPKRSKTVKVEENRKLPTHLPARAFADGVVDVLTDIRKGAATAEDLYHRLPDALRDRLAPILDETGSDLVALKARLEQWFDDSMHNLDQIFVRWSKKIAFFVGLVLAVVLNASAIHVAERLWASPVERAAVVASVDDIVGANNAPDATAPKQSFQEVVRQIDALDSSGIPLGWHGVHTSFSWFVWSVVGWVVTALLAARGAPFWYQMIGRLVSLRRGLAPPAVDDPASATAQVNAEALRSGRTAYAQTETERDRAPTPDSSPAQRLFEALPVRR